MNKQALPDSLVQRINEFTKGGYILFFADGAGTPRMVNVFDDEIYARGLLSFAIDVLNDMRRCEKLMYEIDLGPPINEDEENRGEDTEG